MDKLPEGFKQALVATIVEITLAVLYVVLDVWFEDEENQE